MLSLLALDLTHQKGLSYKIFELEDSGLPQQGILPISARKTTTMATDVWLEKDSPHCALIVCLWKNTSFRCSKYWKGPSPPETQCVFGATYLWFISVPLDGCWFSWSSWSGWSPSSVCFFRAWAIIEATLSLSTCHTDKNAHQTLPITTLTTGHKYSKSKLTSVLHICIIAFQEKMIQPKKVWKRR